MILSILQSELEKIYHLENVPSIRDYLLSSQTAESFLPHVKKENRPQVLLQENKGEVSLGVYLGDSLLDKIQTKSMQTLSVQDFLTLAEELSHFLYLCWKTQNGEKVSLLDVEFQGEIDKYLLSSRYLELEGSLLHRLFEGVSFQSFSCEETQERYRIAHRLGSKFCRDLEPEMQTPPSRNQALRKLRAFYRMTSQARLNQAEKI